MDRNFTNFVDPVEKPDMQNGLFAQNLLNFKEERYYFVIISILPLIGADLLILFFVMKMSVLVNGCNARREKFRRNEKRVPTTTVPG